MLFMKRPGYDLTWNGVRRRWASLPKLENSIHKSIVNKQYVSRSVLFQAITSKGYQRT